MLNFKKKNYYGMELYTIDECENISVLHDTDDKYYVRYFANGVNASYYDNCNSNFYKGFDSLNAVSNWIKSNFHISDESDDILSMIGVFSTDNDKYHGEYETEDHSICIDIDYDGDIYAVTCSVDGEELPKHRQPKQYSNVERTAEIITKILECYGCKLFSCTSVNDESFIFAAINTNNFAKDLVKVKSSNVWAYGFNLKDRKDKTGNLIVQFKNKFGGAGEVYIYYDVPTMIFRRWQSAPSVGHYFWQYIRNNYNYSKLTGDKRGKLKNAIN